MRYRIFVSVRVDSQDDAQVFKDAGKIQELLKSPFLQMQLQSDGIQLVGEPVVHQPQRE